MLGLTLRQEFKGKTLKGTQIELGEANQRSADEFLQITYPTVDVLEALKAIAPNQSRPLVLMGERGQGKSHLMSVLYHGAKNPHATYHWLQNWSQRLHNPAIADLKLRENYFVISESLNRVTDKYLWDLIFDRHPQGNYIRGKWDSLGDRKGYTPSFELLLELFEKQPTILILDEFQTWFDGLPNKRSEPIQNWAFGFIQNLAELAKEYPELLALVVSIRNATGDAYQQIHRVNPMTIDFKGPTAKLERRKLLLHRLFENRTQVAEGEIERLIKSHLSEYFRLFQVASVEEEKRKAAFLETWPFSHHLLQLLEDQVLVATRTQETRDLIKVLVNLYKRNEQEPIITAAHFQVDQEASAEVVSQLDKVAEAYHTKLRQIAQRNLEAVQEAVSKPEYEIPHLSAIMGSLWLRSLAPKDIAGATPADLQVDVTRHQPIDDNLFQVELQTIVDNSFNIHRVGDRLIFQEEENPQTRLLAYARNARLFTDGSDLRWLANETRMAISGIESSNQTFRVIVLPQTWLTDPWSELDPANHPKQWNDPRSGGEASRQPIIVLPEVPDKLNERLGRWLAEQVEQRRNTIRFLLPRSGSLPLYQDQDLVIYARAILKAREWQAQNAVYKQEERKYQKLLRDQLKQRFDRVAILRVWNYSDPSRCQFDLEKLDQQGDKIPQAIAERLSRDLFIEEDFERLVLQAASNGDSLGKVLRELQEPRPNEEDCIPWLGEVKMKEKIEGLCAKGKIAINCRGTEYIQRQPDEEIEAATRRIKTRMGGISGRELDEAILLLPQAIPTSDRSSPDVGNPEPAPNGLWSLNQPNPVNTAKEKVSDFRESPVTPSAGYLFDPSGVKAVTRRQTPATAPLNLYAKVNDEWGIKAGTTVKNLTLRTESLTGSQLQKLLKELPDGLTYAIELDQEES